MSNFVECDWEQAFLLPPDLRDWLPADDLGHFVIEAVERVDLGAFKVNHRGTGSAQYHPRMMLALMIYCYANGIFSSRRIERATHRDIGVRFVAANRHPDHDTIARFRRENFAAVSESFLQVLLLAKELKLLRVGLVSVDGSKFKANASKHRSVTRWAALDPEMRVSSRSGTRSGRCRCTASPSTRSRRTWCARRWRTRAKSAWTSCRPGRRGGRWTTWWATAAPRCCGASCRAAVRRAACSRWRSDSSAREAEIEAFVPTSYWTVEADVEGGPPVPGGPVPAPAMLPARPDAEAEARKEAGVGIGLGDDLRAIRTALIKAHLACDFEAAFDLLLFQLARNVFTPGCHQGGRRQRALDVYRPCLRRLRLRNMRGRRRASMERAGLGVAHSRSVHGARRSAGRHPDRRPPAGRHRYLRRHGGHTLRRQRRHRHHRAFRSATAAGQQAPGHFQPPHRQGARR